MRQPGVHATTGDVLAGVGEDCHVEVTGSGNEGVRPYAVDPDRAARLWVASEALVGERFP